MADIKFLVTHPGGAHKDEFLACCVLLASNPVRIERREPTSADLIDPSICVLDVGHLHDPALRNFDHHQFSKDHPPTCTLSLVLKDLGLYDDARAFCEWLEPTEWFDSRGPNKTAKWLSVDREVLNKLNSPIDLTLLRRFAGSTLLSPGEPLWEVMRMVGTDMIDFVNSMRSRLDFIDRHVEFWSLGNEEDLAQFLFLPRTDPLPDEPSAGLDQYLVSKELTADVVGLVYPDRRGEGYGLSRFRDNARLDLTRIASHNKVHFAHANGFVAKTSATEIEELKSLLTQSLVEGSLTP